jgi:hypothetical protein
MHGGDIARPLLRSILKQAALDEETFLRLL